MSDPELDRLSWILTGICIIAFLAWIIGYGQKKP